MENIYFKMKHSGILGIIAGVCAMIIGLLVLISGIVLLKNKSDIIFYNKKVSTFSIFSHKSLNCRYILIL